MVGLLRAYLNRGDLLDDLREAVRQMEVACAEDTPSRSVKTVPRERNRLSDEQVRELVAADGAG